MRSNRRACYRKGKSGLQEVWHQKWKDKVKSLQDKEKQPTHQRIYDGEDPKLRRSKKARKAKNRQTGQWSRVSVI
eukprot:2740661-Amphidinium_carterae.1